MQDAEAAAVFAMTIRDGITGLVGVANRASESFPDPTYARRFAAVANLLSELQGHPNIRALNAPVLTGSQPD